MQTIWPDFLSGEHINIDIIQDIQHPVRVRDLIDYLKERNSSIIIYKDFQISGGKALYLSGETSFKPEIIEGRSFSKEDFEKQKPVAIIADDEWTNNRCIIRDGKDYYLHENNEYEIIGRFKRKQNKNYIEMEKFDALCFVNMSASFETNLSAPINGIYSIDAKGNSRDFLNDFEKAAKKINPDIKIEEIKKSKVDDVIWMLKMAIDSSMNFLVMLVFTIFLILLNISSITNYWIEGRKREISIRMLLGGKASAIRNMMFRDYLLIVTIGYGIGVLLAIILLYFAKKSFYLEVTIYTVAIIFCYIACLIIGMISGFIFITIKLKQNILLQMRM
ncbi:MAG: hypothetical protein QME42_06665 [bacterium]|nr:hypothetical protein [bacterium]